MKRLFTSIFILFLVVNMFSQSTPVNRIYEIWDDQPAPNRGADYGIPTLGTGFPFDADWEKESYPIGNGYMGANVFGRTDLERIQITEKTLANEGLYNVGGITNFCEMYLDLGHHNPINYRRSLNLNEAIFYVDYEHHGVKFSREYFANYPVNIIVIKLSADKDGEISFILRAEHPYLRSNDEINTRTGETRSENDLITLSGNIAHFNVNYEGQVKVINDGGEIIASNSNPHAEIRVENANSVILLIAAGTNYELSPHVFLESTPEKKLNGDVYPHDKVSKRIEFASSLGFDKLKQVHLDDYQNLFSRVDVVLSSEVPQITTRSLLENYQNGNTNTYLEELMFHFGRYLLISSSRPGTLPAGLQGVWSQYAVTPWTGGYWHNINVQMNYWGAFSTNLAETFIPFIEYFTAYHPRAKVNATAYLRRINQQIDDGDDEINGWAVGTGASAYHIGMPGGHSGPGTVGFTTKLFWDYYDFTSDTTFLRETGYPILLGASKFLSKTLKPAENGLLLVDPSASPEIRTKDEQGGFGGPYYITRGTTFDQGFIWENHNDVFKAAKILDEEDVFLDIIKDQIKRLDPIIIGASGQIKEFREENEYGEIGDPRHRHISHLCPLFPGTLINSNTPHWLQGARVVLDYRGNNTTGWGLAHRMNLRARAREAEKAREALTIIIKDRTLPNLWTVHPPFQIDANLGLVSGIAEMLVQSHESFIELMPALPQAWKTGEFNGLVARGNFEISAAWENNIISSVDITSNVGGECKIKYSHPGSINITDSAGNEIAFSYKENNIIRFDTYRNGKYTISLTK